MMNIYIAAALTAYLIGSISPALIISKIRKKDLRSKGTGNLGASNTTILIGAKWGVLVAILDILKAYIPVTVSILLFPEYDLLPYVVAACVISGHIFPFYLKFSGGKGFATYMGAILGLSLNSFLIIGFFFLVAIFETDYIVIGTMWVVCSFPVSLLLFKGDIRYALVMGLVSAVIIFKHRANLVRIRNKEEIGLSAAFSGKHKI